MVANAFFSFFSGKKYEAKVCFAEHAEKIIWDNTSVNFCGVFFFHVFDVTVQSIVLISCESGKHLKEKDKQVWPFIHSSRFGTVV